MSTPEKEIRELESFLSKLGLSNECFTTRKDSEGNRCKVRLTLAERVRMAVLQATGEDDSLAADVFGLEAFPDVPHPPPGEESQDDWEELLQEVKALAVLCINVFDPDGLTDEGDVHVVIQPVNRGLYWEGTITDVSSSFEEPWLSIGPVYSENGKWQILKAFKQSLLALWGEPG